MQNGLVVTRVFMVVVGIPIGGFAVNFDGAMQHNSIDDNLCVQEIRSVLIVPIAAMQNLQVFARIRFQVKGVKCLMGPNLLQSDLFHGAKMCQFLQAIKPGAANWRNLQILFLHG